MKTNKKDPLSAVNARLLSERELAGDLLDGRITTDQLSMMIKARGLITYNVVLYLLEQAGAQAQLNTHLTLPFQTEGVQKLAEILAHRSLRREAADYIYLQTKNEYTLWVGRVLELIAAHKPEAILYLLEHKPQAYMKHAKADQALLSLIRDDLCTSARQAVSQLAKVKRKLPFLFRKTDWDECKEYMKLGRDKRTLLTIELGL